MMSYLPVQQTLQLPMRSGTAVCVQLARSSVSTRYLSHKQHQPLSTTNTNGIVHNDINPPPSTRPAPLNLPAPISSTAPIADKFKRYYALGRAYLSFYKTGVKNIFHNYRTSMPYRKRLGLPVYIPVSPTYTPPSSSSSSSTLTRSEHQLTHRSTHDIRLMIPFTLILLTCGEFTPLLIPFFGTAITPSTCRIPSQIQKERVRSASRKRAAFAAHSASTQGSLTPLPTGSEEELRLLASMARPDYVQSVDAEGVLRACAVFGLVKSHDRFLGLVLVPFVYRARLKRYLDYLSFDDGLIWRSGGVDEMLGEEVDIAVDERGGGDVAVQCMDDVQREMVKRRWLGRWLEVRGNFKAE